MKVKINSSTYSNAFLTTQTGFCIKQGEVKELPENDKEAKYYVNQKWLRVVEENKEPKILKTDIPKKTIKEVVSEKNNIEMKEALN